MVRCLAEGTMAFVSADHPASELSTRTDEGSLTPAEYLCSLRLAAGLSVGEVSRGAGVTEAWLVRFEAGRLAEGPNYDLLLRLIQATQPPRPEWWDSGHEHDLNLPGGAARSRERHAGYWEKIDQVRALNRKAR